MCVRESDCTCVFFSTKHLSVKKKQQRMYSSKRFSRKCGRQKVYIFIQFGLCLTVNALTFSLLFFVVLFGLFLFFLFLFLFCLDFSCFVLFCFLFWGFFFSMYLSQCEFDYISTFFFVFFKLKRQYAMLL